MEDRYDARIPFGPVRILEGAITAVTLHSLKVSRFCRPPALRAMAVAFLVIAGNGAQALAEDPYSDQYHQVLHARDTVQNTPQTTPQGRVPRRPATILAAAPVTSPTMRAVAQNTSSRPREKPLLGIISELRGGFFDHDAGVLGRNKESGNDYNFETLFVSPDLFDFMWSPRPMLGVTVNDDGNTSQAYGGLTWEWWPLKKVFFDFGFGFSVHDGNLEDNELGRKDLGSRVLFRESLEVGWNFYNKDRLSIILDHVSHGRMLADANEGMDSLGVRYGYRF